MRPTHGNQQTNNYMGKNVQIPSCCLYPKQEPGTITQTSFKKPKTFIKLGKNNPTNIPKIKTTYAYVPKIQQQPFQQPYEYHEDKTSFLHMIRKYNPNPQTEKEEQPTFTVDSSFNSSGKVGENNLSMILQNLNNEMFSDMFVSESVKEKIVIGGSLGCITEVKSDMEISQRQETLFNSFHINDRT